MAKINWSRKALKQLMTLPSQNRLAIAAKVELLGAFPAVKLDIKKLRDADNQYRLRVGNYRIIFDDRRWRTYCVPDSTGKTQNIDNLLKVRGMPNGEAAVYP